MLSFFTVSGRFNTVSDAFASLSTISGGVLAGANNENMDSITNSGKPSSVIVGTFGSPRQRCALLTASPTIWPASMSPWEGWSEPELSCTEPDSTACTAGALPAWGTWAIWMPVRLLNSSAARCGTEPTPGLE